MATIREGTNSKGELRLEAIIRLKREGAGAPGEPRVRSKSDGSRSGKSRELELERLGFRGSTERAAAGSRMAPITSREPPWILLILDRILAGMPQGSRKALKSQVESMLRAHEKEMPDGEGRSGIGEAHHEHKALREAHDWLKDAGDPFRKASA